MNQFDQIKVAAGLIEAGARERLAAADTLEDKFRVAFKEARNYWMSTDEDIRFKGGIGAVMLHVGIASPEYERITIELDQLKTLSAAFSGVAVDWEHTNPMPDDFKVIGITKLWKESE